MRLEANQCHFAELYIYSSMRFHLTCPCSFSSRWLKFRAAVLPDSSGTVNSQVFLPLQRSFHLYLPCLLKTNSKCLALGFQMRNAFIGALNLVLNRIAFRRRFGSDSLFTHISCIHLKLIILCVSPVTKLGRIQITYWVWLVGGIVFIGHIREV